MNIAILSRGPNLYSTKSLYYAATKRGHDALVYNHLYFDIVIESDATKIYYGGNPFPKVDAVIPRIGSSVTQMGASILRQIKLNGMFTTLSARSLLTSRNKLHTLQILSNEGINIPKTLFTTENTTPDYLLEIMGGAPIIVKLVSGTHGIGVFLAETNKMALSMMEVFKMTNKKYILQEFIKESNGEDIRALVVDGQVVASMKRKAKAGEFRSNLHRGATAISIKLTHAEEEMAIKACEILNLKVAGVDMLQSSNGPLLLEINPSPGLEGIETTTGVDVSGKIIEFIERNI